MANVARFLKSFRFQVQIDANPDDELSTFTLGFQEVTGFDATYDVIEYRDGADSIITPAKFSGLVKYSNITLSRGVASADNSQDFWNWMSVRGNGLGGTSTGAFKTEAQTSGNGTQMRITIYKDDGTPGASWLVYDVWPTKYTGPDLKANASELAIEKLEIAHRGMIREASPVDVSAPVNEAAAT